MKKAHHHTDGFTLIEVLIALVILAIALTALLKITGDNIRNTQRLEDTLIREWVMKQGATMIQIGLLPLPNQREITQVTHMLGQTWYWKAWRTNTSMAGVYQINITSSPTAQGPFTHHYVAFGAKE